MCTFIFIFIFYFLRGKKNRKKWNHCPVISYPSPKGTSSFAQWDKDLFACRRMTPTAATMSFQCAVVFAPKQSLSLPTLSPFPTTAHKPFSLFTQTLQLSATHLTLKALISISKSESKKNVKCGWCAVSSELSNDGGFIVVNFYRFVFIQDPELEVSKHLSFLQVFTEQMIFFGWPYLVQKHFGWDYVGFWNFGLFS